MIRTSERRYNILPAGLTKTVFVPAIRITKLFPCVGSSADVFQSGALNVSLNLRTMSVILRKIFKSALFPVLAAGILCSCAFASELRVTKISDAGDGTFDVAIGNAFEIRGISLKMQTRDIEFPSHSGKGKVYRDVSAVSREYKKYLFDAVSKRELSKADGKVSFKINKFKAVGGHKSVAAFASVIFEDKLEAECRIMKGKRGLWTAWPAEKKDGVWEKRFVFIDGGLKRSVESALNEKYAKKTEEDGRKKTQ